jgi:hypothetical protein
LSKENICLFTNNVSPGVANLIRIIESANRPFHVVADRKTTQPLADHDLCYPMVLDFKKEFLHSHNEDKLDDYSLLLFTWAHWVPYTKKQIQQLKQIINKAQRVILLYDGSFGSSNKRLIQQVRDIFQFPNIFLKVDEVFYLTEYPGFDLFSLFRKKLPYHASPMQAFIFDKSLSDSLFCNYDPYVKRKYLVTVAGTKGPEFRQKVFHELEEFIEKRNDVSTVSINDAETDDSKLVLWAAYNKTLEFGPYFRAMRDSDFVFCLPGTYWTPRPVESTACGAIPIIGDDYLHSYDIPFQDGVNCVIIRNCKLIRNWSLALDRVLAFSDDKIRSLRKNIHNLRNTHLLPEMYVERQKQRLGL